MILFMKSLSRFKPVCLNKKRAALVVMFLLMNCISSFILSTHAQTDKNDRQMDGLNFQILKVPYELIHRVFGPGAELESISFKEWNQLILDSKTIKQRQEYPNESIERVAHRMVSKSGQLFIESTIYQRADNVGNAPKFLLPGTIISEEMDSYVLKEVSVSQLGVSSNGVVGILPGNDVAGIKRLIDPVSGSTSKSAYYALNLSSNYICTTSLEANQQEIPKSTNGIWIKSASLHSSENLTWTFSGKQPPVDLWIHKNDQLNQDARQNLICKTQAEWTLTNETLSGVVRLSIWGPPDRFECHFRIPDDCFISEYLVDGVEESSQDINGTKKLLIQNVMNSKHEIVFMIKRSYPVFGVNQIPAIVLENSRFLGSEYVFNNRTSLIISGFTDDFTPGLITLPGLTGEGQKTGHHFRFFTKNPSSIRYEFKPEFKELVWSGVVDYVIHELSDECYLRFRVPDSVSVDRLKLVLRTGLKCSYAMVRSIKKDSADSMSYADVVMKGQEIEIRIPPDKGLYDRRFLEIKLDLQRTEQPVQLTTPEIMVHHGDRSQIRWRVLSSVSGTQAVPFDTLAKNWLRNDLSTEQVVEDRISSDSSYRIIASWEDFPKSLSTTWNVYRNKVSHEPRLLWVNLIHDHSDDSIIALKVRQEVDSSLTSDMQSLKKTTSGVKGSDKRDSDLSGHMDTSDPYMKSNTTSKFSLKTQREEFLRFMLSIPQSTPIIFVSNESRINSVLNRSDPLKDISLAGKIGLKAIESLRRELVISSHYRQEYAGIIRYEKISDPKTLEQILHLNAISRPEFTEANNLPVVNQNVDLLIDEKGHVQYRFHSTLYRQSESQNIIIAKPDGFRLQRILLNDLLVNAEDMKSGRLKINPGSFQNQINMDLFYDLESRLDDKSMTSGIPLFIPEMNTICNKTTWKVIDKMKREWEFQFTESHKRVDSNKNYQKVASNLFLLSSSINPDVNPPKIIAVPYQSLISYESGMAFLTGLVIAVIFKRSWNSNLRRTSRFLTAMTIGVLASYGISKSWWIVLAAILIMYVIFKVVNKNMTLRIKPAHSIGLLLVITVSRDVNSVAIAQENIYVVMPFSNIEESLIRPKQVIMTSEQLKRTKAFIDSQGLSEPFSGGLFLNATHLIKDDPEGMIQLQSDYEYQDFAGKNSFLVSGPSDDCLSVQVFWNGQKMPLRINPAKSLVEYQLSGAPKGTLRVIKTYRPVLDGPSARITIFSTFVSNFDVRMGENQSKSLYFESQGRSQPLKQIESEKFSLLKQFRIKKSDFNARSRTKTEVLIRMTAVRTPDGVRWYCRIPVNRNGSGDDNRQYKIEMPATHFLLGTSQCRAIPADDSVSNHLNWSIIPDRTADFFELEILQMANLIDKYSLQGVVIRGSEYGDKAIIRWVKSDVMAGDWGPLASTIGNQDVDDKLWGLLVPGQLKSQQTSIIDHWEEAEFQFRPEVPHIDRVVQARLLLQKSTISGQFVIDQSSESELLEIKPILIDLGAQSKAVSVRAIGLLDWGVVQDKPGQFYVRFDVRKRKALRIEVDTMTTFETVDSKSGTGLTLPMALPWPLIDGQIKPPGRLIVEQEVEKESTIWPTPLKHGSDVLKNLGEIRDPDTPANLKRWLYQFEGDQPLPQVQWNVSETFSKVQINHELGIHSNKIQWKCEVEYDPISGPLSSIYLRTNPASLDYKIELDNSSDFDTRMQHTGNQSQIIITRKRAAFGVVRVKLSREFPVDSESPFVLPDIVPLGRGRVEKSVSLSGFKTDFLKIEKIVENGLTAIRNPDSDNTEFWESRKWEFKSTNGNLSIAFKKNATRNDKQLGSGMVLEDLLIDRSGQGLYHATMRIKIHSDGTSDFKWGDSLGRLIYASVGDKIIGCETVMSRKVVSVEANHAGADLLMISQIEGSRLAEFLKSIRERFLIDRSNPIVMAVRDVEFPNEESDLKQISLSEWLSGDYSGMEQSPDPKQLDVNSGWREISKDQRIRRMAKYSQAIPEDLSLLKSSLQLVSGTRQTDKDESSAQKYVDSLVLSHVGSWKFYRYVHSDREEAVEPSFYHSIVRDWVLWSELKRRISVSIIFAVTFLAYYQIRKSAVTVLETDR